MFGKSENNGSSDSTITHQDRFFLASEEVYRRMHTGECKDSTAELMQAALDVSTDDK